MQWDLSGLIVNYGSMLGAAPDQAPVLAHGGEAIMKSLGPSPTGTFVPWFGRCFVGLTEHTHVHTLEMKPIPVIRPGGFSGPARSWSLRLTRFVVRISAIRPWGRSGPLKNKNGISLHVKGDVIIHLLCFWVIFSLAFWPLRQQLLSHLHSHNAISPGL